MRIIVTIGLCVVLSGCESLSAADRVRDRATAIDLAKAYCLSPQYPAPVGTWFAALHQGVWHVWLSPKQGAQSEPIPGDRSTEYEVELRAIDGFQVGGCVRVFM